MFEVTTCALPEKSVCVFKQTTQDKAREGAHTELREVRDQCRSWISIHHVLTFFTCSEVMGWLLRSIAPSATIMIFSLFIPARFYEGKRQVTN